MKFMPKFNLLRKLSEISRSLRRENSALADKLVVDLCSLSLEDRKVLIEGMIGEAGHYGYSGRKILLFEAPEDEGKWNEQLRFV